MCRQTRSSVPPQGCASGKRECGLEIFTLLGSNEWALSPPTPNPTLPHLDVLCFEVRGIARRAQGPVVLHTFLHEGTQLLQKRAREKAVGDAQYRTSQYLRTPGFVFCREAVLFRRLL